MQGVSKEIKKGIVLVIFGLFLAATIVVKTSEGIATDFVPINILKRIVAQAGGMAINIFDPYASKVKKANTGYKADLRIEGKKTRLELQEYLAELGKKVELVEFNNREIVPFALNFDYQPYEEDALELLRKNFAFDEVVKEGKDEFAEVVLLMNWLRNQWLYGQSKRISYNFNALDILRRAKKGEKFFCSEYSTVYVQCALSMGFQARYAGLFRGHVVAEVWSNEYAKWISMDVTHNCYYVKQGVPLSVLQLYQLYNAGRQEDIEVVRGTIVRDNIHNFPKEKLLSTYADSFYIRMRNDWFSNKYPHWHPKGNSIMNGLEWVDRDVHDNILNAWETQSEQQLYFPLNVTELSIESIDVKLDKVYLVLNTFTPNFREFLVTIDHKEPYLTDLYALEWGLHPGTNSLRIVSLNKFGRQGVESSVVLKYQE